MDLNPIAWLQSVAAGAASFLLNYLEANKIVTLLPFRGTAFPIFKTTSMIYL